MTDTHDWRHDRAHVALLQQAHADHIEAIYRALASRPGNPDGAEIRVFGQSRAFAVAEDRLENRAIFTGNESNEAFDDVFRYFADRGVRCVIEINPANFYRTEPFSWQSEVLPLLLAKGCTIEGFRCVWYCDRPPERLATPRVERFGPGRLDDFVSEVDSVYRGAEWSHAVVDGVRHGECGDAWRHYIGYEADQPASTGTLFSNGQSGYLAWWYTHPDYRRRGHQAAGIRHRAADAFDIGCERVFTVTDFNIQSSFNLQRAGFRLAYNYLMLEREPLPVA